MAAHERFVPALGVDWLTPLYDWVAWLTGDERSKRRLVETAGITPGDRVLDLGCGTGTLCLMVKRACPGARVTGVDIDPAILGMARAKIAHASVAVSVGEGSATALPFAAGAFDAVLTTLVLHHLTTAQKRAALAEVRRVLRPGGALHVADFAKPHNTLMRAASLVFRVFDGGEGPAANLRGELPALVAEAGFTAVAEDAPWMTPFGTLGFVHGRTPAAA
jgi:ubiquinone/menaquinone biosynthesis C-methylase UbiE